jgi:anti-sigma B factor antagonist
VSNLQLEITDDGEGIWIALIGELDISEAPAVQEALSQIERSRPPILVLDLRRLSFLDSSGLRLILEADIRAREEGRSLSVVRGPESVHRVFSIALLDRRLHFVDDPAQASPRAADDAPAPPPA